MTKYQDSRQFAHINNDIAVVGEEEIRGIECREKTYSCEFCKRTLAKLIDSGGENVSYYCTNCKITSYDTDDLRPESVLTMSEGPNEEPAASLAPEPTLTRKKKEIKGGLKTLQDKGIKITHYKEGKG
jgi:hypothetical protein